MSKAPSITLERWIQRVAQGDEEAFAALYDATAPQVFGLLVRMLDDHGRAEEVAQEVYVQIWRGADAFDPGRGSGWTWIAMMARSRALDRIRADGSYDGALEGLEGRPADQPLGSKATSPETDALLGERKRLVRDAMEELPEAQRAALEAAFFRGWSHREISRRTSIPLGTVKSRIRAGLEKLEAALRPSLGAQGEGG